MAGRKRTSEEVAARRAELEAVMRRGRYAGADASRTLLGFIFDDALEQGRLPYYDDLGEIRSYLTDLKSD